MISSPPTSSSSFGPYSCHLSLIQSVRTSLVFRSSAEVVVFLWVLLVDTVTLPQTSLTFFLMYPTCSTCDASITRICNRCERGESFDNRRRRVPRTRPASSSLTREEDTSEQCGLAASPSIPQPSINHGLRGNPPRHGPTFRLRQLTVMAGSRLPWR